MNLLFNFYSCACVLVCMFHSSAFTMASNITPDEDKPMHPAGLDMTRGSLQDILDGEDVNVSTALPTVPLDATNPFINPNQTLADIIPDRNLGPLSTLKITDADLIIRTSTVNLTLQLKRMMQVLHFCKEWINTKTNRNPIGRTESRNQVARGREGNHH